MQASNQRFDLKCKEAQKCAPDSIARALETEARRWHSINASDPAVRPMILAGTLIRQLDKHCGKLARRAEIAVVLAAQIQRDARTAAARSSAELSAQAAKIAQMQAEIVQLRADNAALAAVAARPAQPVVEVQAQLLQSDTRTRHKRDGKGDLVESLTEVIR